MPVEKDAALFEKDTALADAVRDIFGEYDSTFFSKNKQVRADLFRQYDALVAYVSFPDGRRIQKVTDEYIAALERRAREGGFPGGLQIKYSEN